MKHNITMSSQVDNPSHMNEDGPSNQGDDSGADTPRERPLRETRTRKAIVSFVLFFASKGPSLLGRLF